MIHYLKPHQINKTRWDECIQQAPNGNIYVTSAWLNSWCNWDALVLDDYAAVMPLPVSRFGFLKISRQPLFTQQLGVFGANVSPELVSNFLNAIPRGWLGGFGKLHLYLNTANPPEGIPPQFQTTGRVTHHFQLQNPEYGFNENALRSLKKAQAARLTLTLAYNPISLLSFFISNLQKITNLKPRHWQTYFEAVHKQYLLGRVQAWHVTDVEGSIHAAAIFLVYKNVAVYSLGASSSLGRQNGAMHMLMHLFFEHCRSTGLAQTVDFAGSMQPGIARFFKSLGGKEVIYPEVRF